MIAIKSHPVKYDLLALLNQYIREFHLDSLTMCSPPYIFFHSRVEEGTNPALHNLHTLNDAPNDILPSLTINVSQPKALLTWLGIKSATLITNLPNLLDATSRPSGTPLWCQLFDKLQREATNIQHLRIYWDAEGPWGTGPPWRLEGPLHFGLGRSVVFLRGLVQLKVKKGVEIGGFYAEHSPRYLEKMGWKPFDKQNIPVSFWERLSRDYQSGTSRFNPWTNTKDESSHFGRDYQFDIKLVVLVVSLSPVAVSNHIKLPKLLPSVFSQDYLAVTKSFAK